MKFSVLMSFWKKNLSGLCGGHIFLDEMRLPNDVFLKYASFGNWRAGDTFLVYPKGEMSARLLALRAGIVAAEKIRILGDEAHLSGLRDFYDYGKAMSGAVDFDVCRKQTENEVNND